ASRPGRDAVLQVEVYRIRRLRLADRGHVALTARHTDPHARNMVEQLGRMGRMRLADLLTRYDADRCRRFRLPPLLAAGRDHELIQRVGSDLEDHRDRCRPPRHNGYVPAEGAVAGCRERGRVRPGRQLQAELALRVGLRTAISDSDLGSPDGGRTV